MRNCITLERNEPETGEIIEVDERWGGQNYYHDSMEESFKKRDSGTLLLLRACQDSPLYAEYEVLVLSGERK
jgi:hypothetical protein